MLDITKLLQDSIYYDNKVLENRDLLMGPESHLQEILLRFLKALDQSYQPSINYGLDGHEHLLDHQEQLSRFTEAMHWLLLFSARKQWTHLIVIDPKEYQRILNADVADDFKELDKEYLTITNLVMNAYYTHQQDYFCHAWHLFLKLGLVDWHLNEKEIMSCHQQLLTNSIK